MKNVLSIEEYGIAEGVVFSNGNIKVKDRVVYYPIYMVMFLHEEAGDPLILPIKDFSF